MRSFKDEELIDLADKCFFTLGDRKQNYENWRQYYFQGAIDQLADVNTVFGEINNYLSLIFSPEHVLLEGVPIPNVPELEDPLQFILDHITDTVKSNYFGNRLDLTTLATLKMALIDGTRIIKSHWSASTNSVRHIDIPPELFGVIYEGLAIDDPAQIFCERTDLTKDQVKAYYPEVFTQLEQAEAKETDQIEESAGLKVLLGGQNSSDASINVAPQFEYKPRSAIPTYTQKSLWMFEHAENQWRRTVIVGDQVAKDKLTGLSTHFYHRICPIPISGYFWGLSCVYLLHRIQDRMNHFLQDDDLGLNKTVDLLMNPPLLATGYNMGWESFQEEKKQLRTPGGHAHMDGQNSKVEPWTPKLEIEAAFKILEFYEYHKKFILGINEIMQGQSQRNVRSQGYASMLAQFAATQVKMTAHTVEAQMEELFTSMGKLFQINDKTQHQRKAGDEVKTFLLAQYSKPYRIEIYAHTGSPITTENNINLSLTLTKLKILPAQILVRIIPMPFKAKILTWIEKMEKAAEQKHQEEVALAEKGVKIPGKGE